MNLSQNPLKGWDILITRSAEQGRELSEKVIGLGGKAIHIPMIEFRPAEGAQDYYLKKMADYDWIIFTSANTVRFFFQALEKNNVPIPATMKWAAVGDKTKKILQKEGIEPDFVPNKFSAEDFVEEFITAVKGGTILFPHGNLARNIIPEGLRNEGFTLDDWTIYETFFPDESRGKLKDWLQNCGKAVVTFTSPSTVRNFMEIIGLEGLNHVLPHLTAACIGPVTGKEMKRFGFIPRICPPVYTTEAMVNEMMEYIQKKRGGRSIMELNFKRHRRLRQSANMRALVRETYLHVEDLIYPLFIVEGENKKNPVKSMPGVYQYSLDLLKQEMDEIVSLGIKSVILFGVPEDKDSTGTGAYHDHGIVQEATRAIKEQYHEMIVIADTCLCEYTDHGHCGVVEGDKVLNDPSLDLLARTAVSQAKAGADIIAPSNMMDGFVAAIRKGLDEAGFEDVPIMSYAVKYASSFYGPFRDAADSTPQFGDRRAYQMDPANRMEALREAQSDMEEGADFLIVKPALSYLDIMRDVKNEFNAPLVAYNVSGEYSMVKAAAQNGWIDEKGVVMEKLIAMKRAGADLLITYHAKDVANWLNEK